MKNSLFEAPKEGESKSILSLITDLKIAERVSGQWCRFYSTATNFDVWSGFYIVQACLLKYLEYIYCKPTIQAFLDV